MALTPKSNKGKSKSKNKEKSKNIDLALSVMCAVAKRDETLSAYQIADLCGCSPTYIQEVYQKGINKLKGEQGLALRKFV